MDKWKKEEIMEVVKGVGLMFLVFSIIFGMLAICSKLDKMNGVTWPAGTNLK